MTAQNYHNETVDFRVDNKVNHVTDEGTIVAGTIRGTVAPDLLEIAFDDGDEGTEKAATCYHP